MASDRSPARNALDATLRYETIDITAMAGPRAFAGSQEGRCPPHQGRAGTLSLKIAGWAVEQE
jgi:hypothetical protein